ncbi:MAG: ParB/RepB/Spo0J family partition protein [Chloroflexi bacterium]|nr:ParB/RepB/Spo0J family partition protein [Chloroflexota bacterium]
MKIRTVDPRKIQVPEVRVTSVFDSETLAMFKQAIKDAGILEPPLVVQVGKDLVLVDGLHRLQEAIANNITSVQVAVVEGEMKDVFFHNLATNQLRGKTRASEMVEVIGALWKEYGVDSDEIAKRTGLSRDYIEKLMVVSQATPAVREALDEDLIKVGHAYLLAKIEDPEIQERVLQQQLVFRWKVADLAEHIRNVGEVIQQQHVEQSPAGPVEPMLFECEFCHEMYRIGQVSNPRVCVSCAGILADATRQRPSEVTAP